MVDKSKRDYYSQQKAKIKRRINTEIDPENYEFIPQKKQSDYYDNQTAQRVGVYVRVSTDSVMQTSSYELQKKYYEDFILHHKNWTLVSIYADEAASGTSLSHREEFSKMIDDCKNDKLDLIITKSVSRFARNVVDCISIVRMLSELKNPVGVFFESECIFSLNDDSQMTLTFQATIAQEESHIRSRSMETSLRMRLDGGLPLTPKLLGYSHDEDGNLIINPDEARTVKLIFYLYLLGSSTTEIAEKLTELGHKTYLGNTSWSSGAVVSVLRNERHCGDVLTRKTFTPNYLTHKARKNRGDRPQSIYKNHHEAIVTREDFVAVQHLLNNSKYKNKSVLPSLYVIKSGILKGFVTINPRWSGFKRGDYINACKSAYVDDVDLDSDVSDENAQIKVSKGDFDMRGYEIARSEYFNSIQKPYAIFCESKLKLSTNCIRKFGVNNKVELLVNPLEKKFAVRITSSENRQHVVCSKLSDGTYYARDIAGGAYMKTLFSLFDWNIKLRYRLHGTLYEKDEYFVYVFDAVGSEVFINETLFTKEFFLADNEKRITPLSTLGKGISAVPKNWVKSFGDKFYKHRHNRDMKELNKLNIEINGQVFETDEQFTVTQPETLQLYISEELKKGC